MKRTTVRMTNYIYDSHGIAVGFWRGRYVYELDGRAVGQLRDTHVHKITGEYHGTKARLFVHGAAQPCLIVNDMKLGDSEGAVALFVGPGTEGYFANLRIT